MHKIGDSRMVQYLENMVDAAKFSTQNTRNFFKRCRGEKSLSLDPASQAISLGFILLTCLVVPSIHLN